MAVQSTPPPPQPRSSLDHHRGEGSRIAYDPRSAPAKYARPSYIPLPGASLGAGAGAGASIPHLDDTVRNGRSSSLSTTRTETPTPIQRTASFAESSSDDGERVLPVKVAVRIRPLLIEQPAAQTPRGANTSCLEVQGTSVMVSAAGVAQGVEESPKQGTFNFDYVYGPDSSQLSVYETSILPLLNRFVEGYNVTILAYGQTSSGKTYTMGTDGEDNADGVVPRSLDWIFSWMDSAPAEPQMMVSFLEVYNEDLIDLIALTQYRGVAPPIFVREDNKGRIVWSGVKEVPVRDARTALALLSEGSRERQTGGTKMNDKSSRSHAIYSLTLTQISKSDQQTKIVSKLHFVDLAGSERLKKTQAVGERQREGISINSGLLALGNVISALSSASSTSTNNGGNSAAAPLHVHVPYRDSKLTHMLRDSLGGSAQTLLMACVSPAELNVAETLNTLKYASRARNIRNRGGINRVTRATVSVREAEALREMIRKLKAEIQMLREQNGETLLPPSRDSLNASLTMLSKLAGSPPAPTMGKPLDDGIGMPTRIPNMNAVLQRRSQMAEELQVLRARNQALEGELEQLNDTYTQLLFKFDEACDDMEEKNHETFEAGKKLRGAENEIRRLTGHSRRESRRQKSGGRVCSATVKSLLSEHHHPETPAQLRHSAIENITSTKVPGLPDLTRLNGIKSESISKIDEEEEEEEGREEGDGPGAAEFDAILEEYDENMRAISEELQTTKDQLAAVRSQLSMQETKSSFADKLTASQAAQIDNLRDQLSRARQEGMGEEEQRRALEAELKDTVFLWETKLETSDSEWRLELQHADEQWTERWDQAMAEHKQELNDLRAVHAGEVADLRKQNTQLMSPPPTAQDLQTPRVAELEIELKRAQADALDFRKQAEEADQRARQAEDALAELHQAQAAEDEEDSTLNDVFDEQQQQPPPQQPPMARSISEIPQQPRSRIVLRARHQMRMKGADMFASYPELQRPATSQQQGHQVYDEEEIRQMLRDAAEEAEEGMASSQQMMRQIRLLRESKQELQGKNSQLHNVVKELGDRLMLMAEETDGLECKANERDRLIKEMDGLKRTLARYQAVETEEGSADEKLQTRLRATEKELAEAVGQSEECQRQMADLRKEMDECRDRADGLAQDLQDTMRQLDQAREATGRLEQQVEDTQAESQQQRQLVACLQEGLSASEENARETKLAMDRYAQELVRAQQETRGLIEQAEQMKSQLEDARQMVGAESRDRDIWKERCQDLRDQVDEMKRMVGKKRQSKLLCF